jgi:hypothetical protein
MAGQKWKISAKKVTQEKIKLTDFREGIHFTSDAGDALRMRWRIRR